MTNDPTPLQERIEAALLRATDDGADRTEEYAAAVLPIIAAEVRKGQAEAVDGFRTGLADHLDLGTPRAWDFHHPCDPPGVRWEPTERDKALMGVADMLRKDTANPYRDTHYPEETP